MLVFSTRAAAIAALATAAAICALSLLNTSTVYASNARPSFHEKSAVKTLRSKRNPGDGKTETTERISCVKQLPRRHPAAVTPPTDVMHDTWPQYIIYYSSENKGRSIGLNPCSTGSEVLAYIIRKWPQVSIRKSAGLCRLKVEVTTGMDGKPIKTSKIMMLGKEQLLEDFFKDMIPGDTPALFIEQNKSTDS